MSFVRRYGIALIFFIALGYGVYANSQAVSTTRAASYERCVAGAKRVAFEAAFQQEAAVARRAAGDIAVAIKYGKLANGIIGTLPAEKGKRPIPAMAQVTFGPVQANLKPESLRLIRQACDSLYG